MEVDKKKCKVLIWPELHSIDAYEGDKLITVLKQSGYYIKSTCGARASCGDCVIKIKSGESGLNPANFEELKLLGNVFHLTKERLSCQATLCGDVTIDISMHDEKEAEEKREANQQNQLAKSRLRKKNEVDEIKNLKLEEQNLKTLKKDVLGGNRKPRAFNFSNNDDEN